MRVLVTAYSCEPNMGSEPGTGWNWVKQIASRHSCHLITRENNVAAIEAEARKANLTGLTVHGYDLPRWARFWKRGQRGSSLYYYLWQLGLIRLAKKLDRQHDFDVLHHVTYVANYLPSGLAFLAKPFVWGPVGQHPRIPRAFIRTDDLRLRLAEVAKVGVKWIFRYIDPLFQKTLQNADVILSLSESFDQGLDTDNANKVIPYPAVGVDEPKVSDTANDGDSTFDVLYSGRLVDLKGARLVLAAFAEFAKDAQQARLRFLGDGPLSEPLRDAAVQLGIADHVQFNGQVPYEEALAAMQTTDVFLFPSFEGAGMVVIEAMAAQTPVLCLDFGGPGRMVGEDRGVRVPVESSFEATAQALSRALHLLATDETLRKRITDKALLWVREQMTWDAKGQRIEGFYQRAIDHRKGRAA